MNEGDIFRWAWKKFAVSNVKIDAGTEYWGLSRIVILRNGFLRDTYWIHDLKNPHISSSAKRISIDRVDLHFVANIENLNKVPLHTNPRRNYHPRDIVDLNHPNSSSGNLFLKKSATTSKKVLKQYAERVVEHHLSALEYTAQNLKDAEKQLASITSGDSIVYGPSDMYFKFSEEAQ